MNMKGYNPVVPGYQRPGFWAWAHHLPENLQASHEEHLGPPQTVDSKGAVWIDPTYAVKVQGQTLALYYPEGGSEELAETHYLWDMGQTDHALSRKEYTEWFDRGYQAGIQVALSVPSASDQQLKDLVWDILGNRVFLSSFCRGNTEMTFMPLIMGALSPQGPCKEHPHGDAAWQALQTLPSDPGHQPKPPEPPQEPPVPQNPAKPVPPVLQVPDPTQILELKAAHVDDLRVHSISDLLFEEQAVEVYLKSIEEANAETQAAFQQKVSDWERQCAQLQSDYQRACQEWSEQLQKWQTYAQQGPSNQWLRDKEISQAAHSGFLEAYASQVGVLYEYMSKAMPMTINGQPVFLSFHLLNKTDWEKILPALIREEQRRKEIEI